MSNQWGSQPWIHPGNPLAFQGPNDPYYPKGPVETFEGNYALKQFHASHTFVPYNSPNSICDFIANVDNKAGSRNNSMLPYSTTGYWKPK